MKKMIFLLILQLAVRSVHAQGYDKFLVSGYLEEQAYSSVLDYIHSIPDTQTDIFLLNAAGYSAYQMGMQDKASGFYQRALLKDSMNTQANLYLGLMKKKHRKYEEALHYFGRLARNTPQQARGFKYMADCYTGLKNNEMALSCLKQAYERSSTDVNIAYQYGEALYEQKNYEDAEQLTQTALLLDSGNVQLMSLAIRCAYTQKKYATVLPLVNRITQMGLEESVYTPLMYGIFAALQLKLYNKSLEFSQYLMQYGIESEQVMYYAAKSYAGLRQYDKSNEMLKKCLALAISENTEAYYTEMAENYKSLKVYTKVQKCYDTARFISGNTLLLYRKALAYDEAKDTIKAKKAYRDFLRLAKNEDSSIVDYAQKRIGTL